MEKLPSSYKDPGGFIYIEKGEVFRQINPVYQEEYICLMKSGLYSSLVQAGLIIPHEEISPNLIKPEKLPFISYPYEWCFSQLKDAALTTLAVQKQALQFGMTLKDATAYNIQFRSGKPVFIDTLSFMRYKDGDNWLPYRQFCQHFLAPLMLMSYADIRFQQLLRIYLDGLPLDLTRKILGFKALGNSSFWLHILALNWSQKHPTQRQATRTGKATLEGMLDSLEKAIKGLCWKPEGGWVDYIPAQEEAYLEFKQLTVKDFLARIRPRTVWDLGANVGYFSDICSGLNIDVVSIDSDPGCVEKIYLRAKAKGDIRITPLVIDLMNPSAASGWVNGERTSLLERSPQDTIMALALIHHLALTHNVPLEMLADFFNRTGTSLIIEFVPKDDPQAQKLLSTRADIFPGYQQSSFEAEFIKYFDIIDYQEVPNSRRRLYLMKKRA